MVFALNATVTLTDVRIYNINRISLFIKKMFFEKTWHIISPYFKKKLLVPICYLKLKYFSFFEVTLLTFYGTYRQRSTLECSTYFVRNRSPRIWDA